MVSFLLILHVQLYSDQQFTLTDPPFFAEAMSSTIIVLGPLGNFLYKLY